jgi:hypothetical protein
MFQIFIVVYVLMELSIALKIPLKQGINLQKFQVSCNKSYFLKTPEEQLK